MNNPAYERNCVQIVASNQKDYQEIKSFTFYISHVLCYMSTVTCHQCQQPQQQTLPLLTPLLCTVVCLWKTNLFTQKLFQNPKLCPGHKKTDSFLSFKFSDMLFDQKSPIHAVLDPCLWHKTRRRTSRHKIFLQFLLRTKLCPGWANVNGAER